MRALFSIATVLLLAATANAKTWHVDGIVVAVDPLSRTMLVSHRPVPGLMGGMAMPFQVEDASELAGLYPGARVGFELVVLKEHSFARHVRKSGEADAVIPPPKEKLKVGEVVPDFQLLDEQGATVRLTDLRGKVVAVNFIYTRCPLPDVCPRLSANFATLQRRFADRLGSDLLLLSVTVDPDYDTPAVLAAYARGGQAALIAPLSNLYPVISVPLAVLLLHETIGMRESIAIAVAEATAVWLAGGDQVDLVAAYRGTAVFWHATTRFTDGFALTGAPETGINVDWVPGPRGPVTYRDLWLRQYVVVGDATQRR